MNDQAITRQTDHGPGDEATYAGVASFMRRRYTRDLSGVDVAVMGVPYDLATTNRSGARLGPRAVRAISSNLAWEESVVGWGFNPFDVMAVVDYGDCPFDPGEPQKVPDEIYRYASDILAQDVALLTLGGDHFVTYPLLKAHCDKHGPLSLVHFDAHSDTWDDKEGRIDHGTMFYHAAREGIVVPSKSAQVGIRTHNDQSHGFNIFEAAWVHEHGSQAVARRVKEIVGDQPCYLTFDIDCLDPSFAPGTGTPVIGGLSSHQVLQMLRGLEGINLVGMDMVEVAPAYDVSEITALAGATIAVHELCLLARNPARGG